MYSYVTPCMSVVASKLFQTDGKSVSKTIICVVFGFCCFAGGGWGIQVFRPAGSYKRSVAEMSFWGKSLYIISQAQCPILLQHNWTIPVPPTISYGFFCFWVRKTGCSRRPLKLTSSSSLNTYGTHFPD